MRPFCEANAIGCRRYSRRLQRAMSDFGIEHSFAQAAARIREHYGIEVSVAAVRQATQEHARAATRFMVASDADAETVEAAITASQVICEMDGSMLPVVEVEKPTPQADPAAAGQTSPLLLERGAAVCGRGPGIRHSHLCSQL